MNNTMDWIEYLVFSFMLLLSAIIGIFSMCRKGGQKTVDEYYLGNRKMSIYPVAMSLVASTISGLTLVGLPSEVYYNGAQITWFILMNLVAPTVNIFLFQPVLFNLKYISVYEYLEKRFDRRVRLLASALYATSLILLLPLVIYGAALPVNQVSGISINIISPVVCLVCIFYTSVGGLKAVVWSDALQSSIMMFAVLTVVSTGVYKVGGIASVFTKAYHGSRLNYFENMGIDPTIRLSFWSATIGQIFNWMWDITSPIMVQRYLSLPTLHDARITQCLQYLGYVTFYALSGFAGLVIYAYYQNCDPLQSKKISRKDQILPYFVLDIAGHLKGLSGLFMAGIVCASLSSMSSGLNAVSGTIYEDFIEPVIGKKTQRTASSIMKIITVVVGLICVIIASVIDRLGTIVDIAASVNGVTGGTIFGLFVMGVLMPKVNTKGAFYGGLISISFMMWTMIGHNLLPKCHNSKPVSIEGCTNLTQITMANETCAAMEGSFAIGFPLNRITSFYYGIMGILISTSCGFIISYFTGFNHPRNIDQQLLAPVIRNKRYDPVRMNEITIEK